MVFSRTSCRFRYKMNMAKVFCVTIRPLERYLSNGVWCILRVDAAGPTYLGS
jgi:hypothetical protein